jgi:ubiquinone/menaquinone biosynthesis C-methylase UbiE
MTANLDSYPVVPRRVRRLLELLPEFIPEYATVLDVGCGDGLIAKLLAKSRPDISVHGVDLLVRQNAQIPVTEFDGRSLPFPDSSFDVVMFVDVIHRAADPEALLREASRVSRQRVVIKGHNRNGLFAGATLRLMDRVENAHRGVGLPYHYWSRHQWRRVFPQVSLIPGKYRESLRLYPWPASLMFGRSLHFLMALTPLHVAQPAIDTRASKP